jgi:hypothetical protein
VIAEMTATPSAPALMTAGAFSALIPPIARMGRPVASLIFRIIAGPRGAPAEDLSGSGRGQVAPAEMDAGRARRPGDVRTVVDDERDPGRPKEIKGPHRHFKKLPVGPGFAPELDERRAAGRRLRDQR